MKTSLTNPINRHQFLRILAGGALGAACPRLAFAQAPAPQTHTYKVAQIAQRAVEFVEAHSS
jgi:hypothetical protein